MTVSSASFQSHAPRWRRKGRETLFPWAVAGGGGDGNGDGCEGRGNTRRSAMQRPGYKIIVACTLLVPHRTRCHLRLCHLRGDSGGVAGGDDDRAPSGDAATLLANGTASARLSVSTRLPPLPRQLTRCVASLSVAFKVQDKAASTLRWRQIWTSLLFGPFLMLKLITLPGSRSHWTRVLTSSA